MVLSGSVGTASTPVENNDAYWTASKTTKPRLIVSAAERYATAGLSPRTGSVAVSARSVTRKNAVHGSRYAAK